VLNSFSRFHSKPSAIALILIVLGGLLGVFLILQGDSTKSSTTSETPLALLFTVVPSGSVQLEANVSQVFLANISRQDGALTYLWSVKSISADEYAVNGTNYLLVTTGSEANFKFLDTTLDSCWLIVTAEANLQSGKAIVKIENKNTAAYPVKQPMIEQNTNEQNNPLEYQLAQVADNPSNTYNYFLGSSYIIETDGTGGYRAINGSTGTVAFTSVDGGSVITRAWNVAPTFVRNGVYVCNTPVVADSGHLKLTGESRNGVILAYTGQGSAISIIGSSYAAMKNGVTIESLTINGQTQGLNGIYLEKASVSRISNVEIQGFLNNGVCYGADCWSGILSDSYLHDNGNAGVELGYFCNEIRINNCIVNDDKYGVLVSGCIDQLIVQNTQFTRQAIASIYSVSGIGVVDINANYFENSSANLIYFDPPKESPISSGVISSNFFSITKQHAIKVDNTNNLMISGNLYQFCGEGEIVFGNATHSNIVNEPLQTIRVAGLGTRNVWISVNHVADDTWALRFNNMNIGQNTIANEMYVTFLHDLAKKPIHVEIGWQNLGYGDWAWFADDQTITVKVANKGTFSFSWMAWY
jgi:hypothetical protein